MATLTASPDPGRGRVLLEWSGATIGDRILRDGIPVRYPPITAASGIVFDYEAQPGQPHSWTLSGATTTGSLPAPPNCDGAFLAHPTNPDLTQKVKVRDDNPNTWEAPGTVHEVMGTRAPIVTHTLRTLHRGTLVFWTPWSQRQDIIDLFADGTPILLNPPTCCPLEYEWTWGSLTADKIDVTGKSGIWWTYDYQRIARPSGDIVDIGQAANTYQAVLFDTTCHPTYATLGPTDGSCPHPDYADLLATPHPHGGTP